MYLSLIWDPNRYYPSESEWTWVVMTRNGTYLSRPPELEPHHQKQFSVMQKTVTFLGGGYRERILIGRVGGVFANGPEDQGSVPVWVIPKI